MDKQTVAFWYNAKRHVASIAKSSFGLSTAKAFLAFESFPYNCQYLIVHTGGLNNYSNKEDLIEALYLIRAVYTPEFWKEATNIGYLPNSSSGLRCDLLFTYIIKEQDNSHLYSRTCSLEKYLKGNLEFLNDSINPNSKNTVRMSTLRNSFFDVQKVIMIRNQIINSIEKA